MTIGVLVVAAVAVHINLPYADVLEVVYTALSSALACRVFRMLLLCTRESEDAALSLRAVEAMPMTWPGTTSNRIQSKDHFAARTYHTPEPPFSPGLASNS